MFHLDDITKGDNKEHNKNWPYIHLYRNLIIGGSG